MKAMTTSPKGTFRPLGLLTVLCLMAVTGLANAQQAVDSKELQKLLEQQKEALAEVEANRSATEAQAQQARDALAEQEKHKAKIEQEVDALCKDQEALKPGSYDDCMAGL